MTPVRLLFALTALAAAPAAVSAQAPAAGLHTAVAFTAYSPLAANSELARRLLSPLTAAQIPRRLARSGRRLAPQAIDLAQETFALYRPARAPAAGYGLIVFVPPWDRAQLPPGWAAVLERSGVIFVSADRSGNDQPLLSRREPLALTAAHDAMTLFRIDPKRVWVAGFSGGSRVAMRLALAYPDLFDGALLDAGSDPIGGPATPLPPAMLMSRFQQSSRLVFISGDDDPVRRGAQEASLQAMRTWCVFHITSVLMPFVGHTPATATALGRALGFLAAAPADDRAALAACRARRQAELDRRFREAAAWLAAGRVAAAEKRLQQIDQRYGGLAAPASLELESEIAKAK